MIDPSYIKVSHKSSSDNNILFVFVKAEAQVKISEIELTKVKFKSLFNQVMSTKCGIVIRFSFLDTKIVFCGCQLEYGQDFNENRNQNLRDLHDYAFQ